MNTTPTVDLLTAADEVELARRIEAGLLAEHALMHGLPTGCEATVSELVQLENEGRAAWEAFLLANTRLVWHVVHREAGRSSLEEDELFQEGFLGLVQALHRFDFRRGTRFSTFALVWISCFVARAAASRCGDLALPPSRALQRRRVRAVQDGLTSRGAAASPAAVAGLIGRTEEWTKEVLEYQPPVSLHADDGSDLDVAAPDTDPWDTVVRHRLVHLVNQLPPVERDVVRLRFGFATGEPLPLRIVAARLGQGIAQVRRVERRALGRLRQQHRVDDAA